MQTDQEQDKGRRDFLRQAARWAVALTLGGGIVALSAGRGRDCANNGFCDACAVRGSCPSATVNGPGQSDKAPTHE